MARRCVHIRRNGKPCRALARAGLDHCHIHSLGRLGLSQLGRLAGRKSAAARRRIRILSMIAEADGAAEEFMVSEPTEAQEERQLAEGLREMYFVRHPGGTIPGTEVTLLFLEALREGLTAYDLADGVCRSPAGCHPLEVVRLAKVKKRTG